MDELLVSVEEAARRIAVGRSHLYELLGRGEIESIRIGRSRRIPVTALEEYTSRKLDEARSEMS